MSAGKTEAGPVAPRAFSISEPGTPWWQTAKDCGAWTDRNEGDVGYVHFGSTEALRVYTLKVTQQALKAAHPPAQEQPAPAVPQKWKLVPVEPTPEMVAAYLAANHTYWKEMDEGPAPIDKWRNGTPAEATAESYQAMIAAAPAHPTPAERAEQPLPLLVRDIAAELGVTPLDACKALKTIGLGDYSVNMAVTATMAGALRQHFAGRAEQLAQKLTDEQIDCAISAWFSAAKKGIDVDEDFRTRMRAAFATLKGQP